MRFNLTKKLESQLLKRIFTLQEKLSLLTIKIYNNLNSFQNISLQKDQFQNFFKIWFREYKQVIIINENIESIQFVEQCPICCKSNYRSCQEIILHLIFSHRLKFSFNFTTYLKEKQLQIKIEKLSKVQQNGNDNGNITYSNFGITEEQNLEIFLRLFQISNSCFEERQCLPLKQDQKIENLMLQKQFYWGPEQNYKIITSTDEFKQKEIHDEKLFLENELKCLYTSAPEFQGTSTQQFMQIYNTRVLEQKPKNIKEFQLQFVKLTGQLAICFQNHLFTLLCYNMIDLHEFLEISLQIQK